MDLSSLFSLFVPPDGSSCTFTAKYFGVFKNSGEADGYVTPDTVILGGAGNLKTKQIDSSLINS